MPSTMMKLKGPSIVKAANCKHFLLLTWRPCQLFSLWMLNLDMLHGRRTRHHWNDSEFLGNIGILHLYSTWRVFGVCTLHRLSNDAFKWPYLLIKSLRTWYNLILKFQVNLEMKSRSCKAEFSGLTHLWKRKTNGRKAFWLHELFLKFTKLNLNLVNFFRNFFF